MSQFTLSEQAERSSLLQVLPSLMSSIHPSLCYGEPQPARATAPVGGEHVAYAPTVSFRSPICANFDDASALALSEWPQETHPTAYGINVDPNPFSIYDAVIDSAAEDLNASLRGIVSIHPSRPNAAYASTKGAQFIYALRDDVMFLYRPGIIDAAVEQVEHADEFLSSLQDEVDRIKHVSAGSLESDEAEIGEETIETCKELIRMLPRYLVRSGLSDEAPFIVPSPDGSILFKWIRHEKELSITIEQSSLQVQRWTPLSSYESEGCWELQLDEVGEQFDWLTR